MKMLRCAGAGLLLLSFGTVAVGGDTRLTRPDGRTGAYIDDRGRIAAPDGKTLGYIEPGGRIAWPDGSTASYLEETGGVVNKLRSDRPNDSSDAGQTRR